MKTWSQLTIEEQQAIREDEWKDQLIALNEIGPVFIGEAGHPVRVQYEKLIAHMERMRTPWFLSEAAYH